MHLRAERDALIYVPRSYIPGHPTPTVITLHGAGSNATRGLHWFRGLAEKVGTVLVSPASEERTWDLILGGFGDDVAFIESALEELSRRVVLDEGHIALEGFSDGASYALSLGLTNGDLFSHVIAFSPGFMAPEERVGSPRIFVSHGKEDEVLPIDRTSRAYVPELENDGYDVTYVEFPGGHYVPRRIVTGAMSWFLGPRRVRMQPTPVG